MSNSLKRSDTNGKIGVRIPYGSPNGNNEFSTVRGYRYFIAFRETFIFVTLLYRYCMVTYIHLTSRMYVKMDVKLFDID